jgi:hypothetical protein
MISSLVESFKSELKKEENIEYLSNLVNPFINKYKTYFYIIVTLLIIIATSSCFSSYMIYKYHHKK